ncbi:MAG: hypothetical protein MRERC_2c113 [Mycoplasmataceae bacterium RC_NB112A]|nr:MAG: hypothetical protein MRERC_2c113 [Mycoplasmataceae bacterium RC_NB112A]
MIVRSPLSKSDFIFYASAVLIINISFILYVLELSLVCKMQA